MKNLIVALILSLGLAPSARAAAITAGQNITSVSAGALQPAGPGQYSGNLVNETGLAYNNTYLLDMSQYNATQLAAQAFYTSTTFSNASVTDGSEAGGSVRVISTTGLTAASATIQITVTTNSFGATLPNLIVGNCSLTMGKSYVRGATKLATAQNLAAAITACNSSIAAAAASNAVIYATATAGSYANAYNFTSNNSSITVSASRMGGGADNACLTINGTALCNGTAWTAGASTNTAVLSLGNAIANAGLSLSTQAVGILGIIYTTSTLNGTAYNYTLASSTPTALSVSAAALTGGTNSGFTLSSQKIVASAAGLTLGLPVLYAVGSNPAIGGLTTGTTYFAVPAGGTSFYLAKYSTSAVAGLSADYVTITSTASATTAHTYTFAPLAITGTPSFKWQVSNDNSAWDDLSVSSVTMTSYTLTPTVTSWGFGPLGYRYIRANVVAPTTGAIYLKIPVQLTR